MTEMEVEAGAKTRELEEMRNRMDKLVEDNVKLYEKIKYVGTASAIRCYGRAVCSRPCGHITSFHCQRLPVDVVSVVAW